MDYSDTPGLTVLTVELLAAYVGANSVRSDDLPALIRSTHAALASTGKALPAPARTAAPAAPVPAVSVRSSLSSPDHIISLIDGKPYKTLKRHLRRHGLTPEDYRARYRLPPTYPMVAPTYSERRREVAVAVGLGRRDVPAKPATAVRRSRRGAGADSAG